MEKNHFSTPPLPLPRQILNSVKKKCRAWKCFIFLNFPQYSALTEAPAKPVLAT